MMWRMARGGWLDLGSGLAVGRARMFVPEATQSMVGLISKKFE